MDKSKSKNLKPQTVVMWIATYLSFALAYSFAARGLVAKVDSPIIANVFVAALAGGILPTIIFEFGIRLFSRPLDKVVTGLDKSVTRLRLFFIGGNVATFLVSLLYYFYPFLSIWGGILLNFIVLLAALVAYLVTEFKRMEDKTRAAYLVMQAGVIFLFMFAVATIAGALLGGV